MTAANKVMYTEIGQRLRELPQERPFSSYRWEELVQRMCASDDAGLHDIGLKELDELNRRRESDKR